MKKNSRNRGLDDHQLSIVIPTRGGRLDLLEEALCSASSGSNKQITNKIIIDNSPHQNSESKEIEALAKKYFSQYVRTSGSLSMFENWNFGIDCAKTEWVTLLHDDDTLYPWFYETVSKYLNKADRFSGIAVGATIGQRPWLSAKKRTWFNYGYDGVACLVGTPTPAPGIILRKDNVIEAGGFRPSNYPSSDYALYIAVSRISPILMVGVEAAHYRVNENQATSSVVTSMLVKSLMLRNSVLPRTSVIRYRTFKLFSRFFHVNFFRYMRTAYPLSSQRHLLDIYSKVSYASLPRFLPFLLITLIKIKIK